MNKFLVDLHIHTLLSPCGELSMSPAVIVERAVAAGLDAIAVCDHNSTLQVGTVCEVGKRNGLVVFRGAELTTREEGHCVAIMPDDESLAALQQWIDANIVKIPNVPEKFGDQVWVDSDEMIGGEVEWYLNSPIDASAEEVADKVAELGGLLIPAHVERPSYSVIGQLGFLPPGMRVNAVEYNNPERFAQLKSKHKYLGKYTAYTASDAHFPEDIGKNPSWLYARSRTFDELRMALAGEDGRRIISRKEE